MDIFTNDLICNSRYDFVICPGASGSEERGKAENNNIVNVSN